MKLFYKTICISLFVLASCQRNQENVYDYYQSLPESFFFDADLGDIKYNLQKIEGSWKSQSLAGNDIVPIVDIENGYIEINDEGTGGGNILTQVVLFRTADNSPIIGITKGGFNGIYFESTTAFYKKQGNKWLRDKNVFPELNIQKFLNSNYQNIDFQKYNKVSPNLSTLIRLPQFGTKIDVELNFNKFDYLIESNNNVHTQQGFSKKETALLWEIIENISVESFQLKFNKTIGKFEISDSTIIKTSGENEIISDERYILNQIWLLNEIKQLASYIESESNNTRRLQLSFDGEVQDKPNYVLVRAIEDNGGNWVTHFIFHVSKNGSEIYQYDTLKDDFIKINQ